MKTLLLAFVFSLSAIATIAQVNTDTTATTQSKLSLGVNLHTMSYHIYYKEGKTPGAVRAGYFVPVSVNVGYQLTDRIKLQAGLGAGGDKHQVTEQDQDGEQTYEARTIAFVMPVSGYLTVVNLYKKLPIYGVFSVVPAYGVTTTDVTETYDSGTRNYSVKDSGINVFAVAGAGFNYKISERFYGNVSYFFYKTNLTGRNSRYFDWDYGYPDGRPFLKSLEFGLNYKL
jgi:hypothetical protein